MKKTTACAFLLLLINSFAQTTLTLDRNNISLSVNDQGLLFEDAQNSSGYEFPKGSGKYLVRSLGLWFAGLDSSNQLHLSSEDYVVSDGEYQPGPYSTNNAYNNPNYLAKYVPAIWKISREEIDQHIDEFNQNGSVQSPSSTILNWPANGDLALGVASNLAPFYDQNNDGHYDPYAGDYPIIKGCEAIYIILNDGNDTLLTNGTPNIELELHIMLYQFNTTNFLNDVTFLDIRGFNRGSVNYSDFRAGIKMNVSVGSNSNDYVGTDPVRNLVFGYDGSLEDSISAVGIMYLNQSITASSSFLGGSYPTIDPVNGLQTWHYMNALWADGTPQFYGGNGYSAGSTTIPTKFMYPGDHDPTGIGTNGAIIGNDWSELNANGGSPNPPGERRIAKTTMLGQFNTNTSFTLHQAIVVGVEPGQIVYENVYTMLENADSVLGFYNSGLGSCYDVVAGIAEQEQQLLSVYPNPSNGSFTVSCPFEVSSGHILVVDLAGRTVYKSSLSGTSQKVDLEQPSGVYFMQIRAMGQLHNLRIVIE